MDMFLGIANQLYSLLFSGLEAFGARGPAGPEMRPPFPGAPGTLRVMHPPMSPGGGAPGSAPPGAAAGGVPSSPQPMSAPPGSPHPLAAGHLPRGQLTPQRHQYMQQVINVINVYIKNG